MDGRKGRISLQVAVIRIRETTCVLPWHQPVPLTRLPLLYHRDHLFPYGSFGGTATVPVPRALRLVELENEFLRIEIAPELGGRVYGLFDKRIGREVLFRNPVIKPVRILPIWGFLSGGIEFNFPIAHSPTSMCEVGCVAGQDGDYGFVRVGEREARTGMEWVVEIGLRASLPAVVQRTALRNPSGAEHPWMLWTIAAVRSTTETEFVHPPHRVLVHDDRIRETDWPGDDLNWDRNCRQMTALFWRPGSAAQFGAFHHDLGFGLLHWADPQSLPGKKVWTYGHGRHRVWGEATTAGGLSYAELESGPLFDQSEKPMFPNGAERRFEECWIPVHARADLDRPARLAFPLPPMQDPWLGTRHSRWQTEWEHFAAASGPLPKSCVPTGLPLEAALRREHGRGNPAAAEPLALWLAFHRRPQEALEIALGHPAPDVCRIAGLILWRGLGRAAQAAAHLESGPLGDPVAAVELDVLYSELGLHGRRRGLLEGAPDHRLVIERRADLALAEGRPAEALRLLTSRPWPREHQRYVRSALWRQAQAVLGRPADEPPDALGEDNLAPFGAYWADE